MLFLLSALSELKAPRVLGQQSFSLEMTDIEQFSAGFLSNVREWMEARHIRQPCCEPEHCGGTDGTSAVQQNMLAVRAESSIIVSAV